MLPRPEALWDCAGQPLGVLPNRILRPGDDGLPPRFGSLSPGALPYLPGRMAYDPSDLFRRLRSVSSNPAPAPTLLAAFGHLPTPGPPQSCEVLGPVTRPATAGSSTLNGQTLFPGPPQSCEVLGPVTRPATAGSSTLNGRALFFRLISHVRQGPVGPSDPGPDIPQGAFLALREKPSLVVLLVTARPWQSF